MQSHILNSTPSISLLFRAVFSPPKGKGCFYVYNGALITVAPKFPSVFSLISFFQNSVSNGSLSERWTGLVGSPHQEKSLLAAGILRHSQAGGMHDVVMPGHRALLPGQGKYPQRQLERPPDPGKDSFFAPLPCFGKDSLFSPSPCPGKDSLFAPSPCPSKDT